MQVSKAVQDALTKAGGTNYHGQPIYRFAWSEHETRKISNGTAYEEFRVCAEDCWLLMKWEPAEWWGSREEWEMVHREPSGLFTAGPFPNEGRYRVLRTLKKAVVKDGVMTFEHPAPSLKFVDEVFPLIKGFEDLTTEQKAEVIETRDQADKDAMSQSMAKSRADYKGSATSRQIADKVAAIERWLNDPVAVKQAQDLLCATQGGSK